MSTQTMEALVEDYKEEQRKLQTNYDSRYQSYMSE